LGSKIIPSLKLEKATPQVMIETMRGHGVEIITSESIRDLHWDIELRNLSINRVLEFITQQVSAHWFYQDGRVVIFRSPTELNTSYKKAFEYKAELEQQIQNETRRLSTLARQAGTHALNKAMILELSINDATLPQIIDKLSMATVTNGLNGEKGINIVPLFNSKLYTETHSYSFKNQSVADILDTICADQQMTWQAGQDAITIEAKH
jgi:hypothetical protein